MGRFHHELLKTVRLDLGLSQEEAARALDIDVRTYRRYESGAVNEGGPFEVRTAARRRLLRKMCDEFGVADEAAWMLADGSLTRRAMAGAQTGRRGHALQRALHFVGREQALARLQDFCAQQGPGLLLVLGVGGAGKTALVERAVAGLPQVFVHSFYDDPRTEAVVGELEREQLVVLDGLEAVQSEGGNGRAFGELEDPALRRALRRVAAGTSPCRVLATSRFPLTDLSPWPSVQTLALPPLSLDESLALLRAFGLRGDDAALLPLCERSGGHALSVAMFGSYVGTFLGGEPAHADEIALEGACADDPVARKLSSVLEAYARALGESERQLLARLSLFAGAVDLPLLAALSDLPEPRLLPLVARLERLGLISRSQAGVTAHPFVRGHFRARLDRPVQAAHAAVRDILVASLRGRPQADIRDPDLLDRYELLLEHTRRSGRPVEAWGIYRSALGGFDHLGLRLGAMTRGARVLAGFAATGPAERGPPEALGPQLQGETRARLLYEWGLYAVALGDLSLAQRCQEAHLQALDAIYPAVARPLRAMGLRTSAYRAWLAGDFEQARSLLGDALALLPEEPFHRVRALALLAMVEHDAGQPSLALTLLAQAHALEPKPTARRAFWEAEILLGRGEVQQARALLDSAVADCARRGWTGHVAHGQTLLGLSWLNEAPERAGTALQTASAWVRTSGEVEVALRCHHLAWKLALARGESERASREAATGLSLATEHGFHRFSPLFQDPSFPGT